MDALVDEGVTDFKLFTAYPGVFYSDDGQILRAMQKGDRVFFYHTGKEKAIVGTATVFGTSQRAIPRFAALANATAMHADDYDDTYHPTRLHPSAPVLASSSVLLGFLDGLAPRSRERTTTARPGNVIARRVPP